MNFSKKIAKSIYGPEYYSKLLQKPFFYSLKYFYLFIFLIALIGAAGLTISTAPKIKSFFNFVSDKVLNQYPQGLEIVVKNGIASSNVEEPYFVPMKDFFENAGTKNLIVIDTKDQFFIENFYAFNTACLLNEKTLACYDDGAVKVTSLSQIPDFTLNKQVVTSFVAKVKPFLKFVYPAFIIGALIAVMGAFSLRLIYLFIAALGIWIVAKIKKVNIGYWKSYQLGIHLMTLPIILTLLIGQLFNFTGIDLRYPFLFSALLLMLAAVNLGANPTTENANQG